MLNIRKTLMSVETVYAEAGKSVAQPTRRACAVAVIDNPLAGRHVEDLSPLFDIGEQLGELLVPQVIALLDRPVAAYGKAAIVGVEGDLEHGSAIIHPKFGRPLRAAVGGGQSVVPSNLKVSSAGACIDVPLGNKDDPWSFPEMDTFSVMLADAPRPREICVVVVVSSGTRPNARSGKTRIT